MKLKIKALRKEFGLTQQSLGSVLGVSQQSIHKYENNTIEPSIDMLKKLAEIFDTSIDYIVGFTDIKHKIEHTEEFYLNVNEKCFIQKFRRLPSKKRNLLLDLVELLIR